MTGLHRASGRPVRAPSCGRRGRGFTLIEMLVVLALIGVLLSAVRPLQGLMARRADEAALRQALRQIRTALDAHREAVEAGRVARAADGSPWPASLAVLQDGVAVLAENGQPREDGQRLYLLRRLPRDPFAPVGEPAERSWATRASQAPPGDFSGGADVFDVATRSGRRALDGSALADW